MAERVILEFISVIGDDYRGLYRPVGFSFLTAFHRKEGARADKTFLITRRSLQIAK